MDKVPTSRAQNTTWLASMTVSGGPIERQWFWFPLQVFVRLKPALIEIAIPAKSKLNIFEPIHMDRIISESDTMNVERVEAVHHQNYL